MYSQHEVYRQYDNAKREELVRDHLPVVYRIARQVANATALGSLEYSDLVNTGVLGLYKAFEKFDESRGYPFGAFATHHVKGSILDELSRAKQIPRGLRDKQTKVKRAWEALSQSLMREPADDEVASYLGLSSKTYNTWLVELGWTSVWSLEDLEQSTGVHVVDVDEFVNPASLQDERDQKAQLVRVIRRLSEREQKVLALYYQEELTLKEIAYVLDLSESQISRIHSKTILKMREWLAEEDAK